MICLWVVLYGLTFTLSQTLSAGNPWLTPLAMALYTGLLILWIVRTGQRRAVGLCLPCPLGAREYLELLPLLLLPVCNLLTGVLPPLPAALLMLSVSAVEELFFRGFLLRFFLKWGRTRGVLITGICFALFHGVNLLQGGDPAYTAMQALCALTVGICYGAVTVKCGSLLPAMLVHCLTNITGIGGPALSAGLWLCIAAYGCYGIWLCRKIR